MGSKGFRQKVASYLFYKEGALKKRDADFISLERAHSIGILYEATKEESYELVKEFVRQLRADHKDVLALGFINDKDLPTNRFVKLGLDFFTKKTLNWKLKPSGPIVENFINTKYDILICLNINRIIPLKYIASESKALFKIGRYDELSTNLYDMMLSVDDTTNLDDYLKETRHYLNKIKNDIHQKT